MNSIDIKNLTGKCLISTPSVQDYFSESVIYICSHNFGGTMGFVINKRVKNFSFQDLAIDLPLSFRELPPPINLYKGGPLEKTKGFILHSDEYKIESSINTGGGIMVSSSLDVLKDIALGKGPQKGLIALGYAGWVPNQVEQEIANNLWLVTDATPDLVFAPDDDTKWQQAIASLGIDFSNWTSFLGHS
ncbi:MAG: YqgE/AlgH family protein [Alphaproteobacteria bacterium]|nr:YqgE/AlgH family protein [Alphaproteobacteria bacterium]